MPSSFWDAVNKVIEEADIILEIVDARRVDETRNLEIEEKVAREGKVLVYVLNKCDLCDQKELEARKKELDPCVFVSAKDYHGIKMLQEKIIIEGKRLGLDRPKVGVVGYPNMGKSSVINALNGTGKARTSSESGFTKGKQYVTARKFLLIDTPGVIPYGEKDEVKGAITGFETKTKDPEGTVLKIMDKYPGILERHYRTEEDEDLEVSLENIARKLNILKKGGAPDTRRASERILKDLREGKIRITT
ncbi:50S ribosome-binding GTPase [Candidatus Woesearchaeota archaeon]|nr:50S ribosome-binding GTPase [Candidatus Woesearchaeota archaeon]